MMQKSLLVAFSLILASAALFSSCNRKSAPATGSTDSTLSVAMPGPPCIIYRTKADYSKQVPVELTADKTQIASFPDVADIYRAGSLAYPTLLLDSFWLDNRGIGPNVAFLKLTYEDYRALDGTPAVSELWDAILDPDPLVEMYQCGNRSQYQDAVTELNEIIRSGRLSECKKLK